MDARLCQVEVEHQKSEHPEDEQRHRKESESEHRPRPVPDGARVHRRHDPDRDADDQPEDRPRLITSEAVTGRAREISLVTGTWFWKSSPKLPCSRPSR